MDNDYEDDDWNEEEDKWEEMEDIGQSTMDAWISKEEDEKVIMQEKSFEILTTERLKKKRDETINTIHELFEIESDEAECLLKHYKWKTKTLEDEWFQGCKKVREKTGIDKSVKESRKECSTMYCEGTEFNARLDCGHWVCDDCWKFFITSQLEKGNTAVFMTCPAMKTRRKKCKQPVPSSVIERFTERAVYEKYEKWLLNDYVDGQNNMRWCPNPKCNLVASTVLANRIECHCGHNWCFLCLNENHTPLPCDLVRSWLRKENSDDESLRLVSALTKECPKCKVRIEKNRACNHMTCSQCKHQFCWLCKKTWDGSHPGGYFACSKYSEDLRTGKISDEEKGKIHEQKVRQKYVYYYERFKGEERSISLTNKLIQELPLRFSDSKSEYWLFLVDSLQKIVKSRKMLQWSYVVEYYLKKSTMKEFFKFHQDNLIHSTEKLQTVIEDCVAYIEERQKIVNLTGQMESYMNTLCGATDTKEFEEFLLATADEDTKLWGCVNCKSDNSLNLKKCRNCGSCQLHGDYSCNSC